MTTLDSKDTPHFIDGKGKNTFMHPYKVICITFMKWPQSINEGYGKCILKYMQHQKPHFNYRKQC